MRRYVERMDAETSPPAPEATYPRILGANGPRMLALAAEIADGALPANLPPAFTAEARAVLGPDKLLVVGLAVIPEPDAARAKAAAIERVSGTLNLPTFSKALRRLNFPLEDVAGIADAIVAHGSPDMVAAKVREHLAAGADHVVLMPPTADDFAADVAVLERYAPAFADLG
jgi:probable F420-dependent oxidoreductase